MVRPLSNKPRRLSRHLNKLRWATLSLVMGLLVLLPFLHLYQTYVAAHAYDLLGPGEKATYRAMEWLTSPFTDDPQNDLNLIKGTTWSGTILGVKLSDPLAVVGQTAAGVAVYWPFMLTALIPLAFTVLFGRFFCGWICPATFVYELNDNVAASLGRAGLPVGRRRLDRRLKYLVLAVGVPISAFTGMVAYAAVYPPAIVGRELYYGIAAGGFGGGAVFFLLTLLFDVMVARRGFCRYVCPGGALYSLLGRYRLLRIRRAVADCNDCAKCNAVCQFGLDPLHDDFGQECNNCSACIAVCPTDALHFAWKARDLPFQGPGHLGRAYRGRRPPKGSASGQQAA
ncbi:MAG: 4Fe-4S binding protein [Gammaproteobacteria bacterium]|nr:4Fe-4S binding protein [Gammaproteobacteria bacterium]NIR98604.1 4Fe-4S binding protein [Gammaproteobacteria bacterium]NIT64327.1 4Fe-4S binding protein [Gammaproteobacteria bacterium]NIV21251.1 4Fe-4S binding protein [Gammaproteobacteria bacterium]NIX10955.1 4Fe-4S binding protein [Gammaproteobacteria bacterium]